MKVLLALGQKLAKMACVALLKRASAKRKTLSSKRITIVRCKHGKKKKEKGKGRRSEKTKPPSKINNNKSDKQRKGADTQKPARNKAKKRIDGERSEGQKES